MVLCSPTLDRPKLAFPGVIHDDGLGAPSGSCNVIGCEYQRETQEMVFDAHDRAFAFFEGACERGIYGNMKTAVETIFVGKDRQYNRRFLQMCGHYLVEPVA